MWTGYNTPKVDVPVAYLQRLNLRDSTVEDNVRKRPITNKILTLMPLWASQVDCKDTTFFLTKKKYQDYFFTSLKKRHKTG